MVSSDLAHPRAGPAELFRYSRNEILEIGCILESSAACNHLKSASISNRRQHPGHRGKRGGTRKMRKIRVIMSNRRDERNPLPHRSNERHDASTRQRNLVHISTANPSTCSQSIESSSSPKPLSYYVINVNSIAKPDAKEQLYADLKAYHIDVAIKV